MPRSSGARTADPGAPVLASSTPSGTSGHPSLATAALDEHSPPELIPPALNWDPPSTKSPKILSADAGAASVSPALLLGCCSCSLGSERHQKSEAFIADAA